MTKIDLSSIRKTVTNVLNEDIAQVGKGRRGASWGRSTGDFRSQVRNDTLNGTVTIKTGTPGERSFCGIGTKTGASLKAGDIVLAYYSKYNMGAQIYEILGVTGDDAKYGDGGVEYSSVKQLMQAKGVKTLAALEAAEKESNGGEYGQGFYLTVRDLNDDEEGPWFYLCEGAWCRGSGAEKLSFIGLEETTQATHVHTPGAAVDEVEFDQGHGAVLDETGAMAELKDPSVTAEAVSAAWPDGVTYDGVPIFDPYMEVRPVNSNYQECYLGYSPQHDLFVSAFEGGTSSMRWNAKILRFDPRKKKFVRVGSMSHGYTYPAGFYQQMKSHEQNGMSQVKRAYPDMIDVRLD